MSNTCDFAVITNARNSILNMDAKMNFLIQQNNAKKLWKAAETALPGRIRLRYDKIDDDFKEGFYLQPRYLSPAITTDLLNSIGAGDNDRWYRERAVSPETNTVIDCRLQSSAGACWANPTQSRICCSTWAYRNGTKYVNTPYLSMDRRTGLQYLGCNYHLDGMGYCQWTGEHNAKLRDNLFAVEISRLKEAARREEERDVNTLKTAYELIKEPTPLPLMEIGCCQQQIFSGISGDNVIVNGNTNQCSIVRK